SAHGGAEAQACDRGAGEGAGGSAASHGEAFGLMFETLSARLTEARRKITGRGVLRPEDVDAALREVRLALLEADVNFKVVKEFVERVRARLAGAEISPGLTAPQTVVKAVDDELVDLLGGNRDGLVYASSPPTVVML